MTTTNTTYRVSINHKDEVILLSKPLETCDYFKDKASYIDDVQLQILQHSVNSPFVLDEQSLSPYGDCLGSVEGNRGRIPNNCYSQNGLAIKTYQSDVFNGGLS